MESMRLLYIRMNFSPKLGTKFESVCWPYIKKAITVITYLLPIFLCGFSGLFGMLVGCLPNEL